MSAGSNGHCAVISLLLRFEFPVIEQRIPCYFSASQLNGVAEYLGFAVACIGRQVMETASFGHKSLENREIPQKQGRAQFAADCVAHQFLPI
jgi:hypothetical protein